MLQLLQVCVCNFPFRKVSNFIFLEFITLVPPGVSVQYCRFSLAVVASHPTLLCSQGFPGIQTRTFPISPPDIQDRYKSLNKQLSGDLHRYILHFSPSLPKMKLQVGQFLPIVVVLSYADFCSNADPLVPQKATPCPLLSVSHQISNLCQFCQYSKSEETETSP